MNLGLLILKCYRHFYLKFLFCKMITTCNHLPIVPIKKDCFILKQAIEICRRMLWNVQLKHKTSLKLLTKVGKWSKAGIRSAAQDNLLLNLFLIWLKAWLSWESALLREEKRVRRLTPHLNDFSPHLLQCVPRLWSQHFHLRRSSDWSRRSRILMRTP